MILERKDLEYLERILAQAWGLEEADRELYLDSCLGEDGHLRRQAAALLSADRGASDSLVALFGGGEEALEEFESVESTWRQESRPRFIGVYRLGEVLGEGGMGTVFRAVRSDDEYRKEVAVKILRRENVTADLVHRFRQERQILAALNHPNIARLLDGGTSDEGLPYLVMDLVRGEPIDSFCEIHHLSLPARLDLIRTICEAVQSAHQNLVVHRDLKPSNILVTDSGEPMLLDFGIAKILNPNLALGGSATTKQWQRVLTPDYASPEQIRNGVVGVTSDVYSIGVMLYQLLTGMLPKRATHSVSETDLTLAEYDIVLPSEAFRKRLREDREGALALASQRGIKADAMRKYLAGDLDRIVAKALHPVSKLRYQSADRLAEDLRWFDEGLPISAREPAWGYRAGKFLRRHRRMALAALLVCFSLAMLVVGLVTQRKDLAQERDLARLERDKAREISDFLESLFVLPDPFGVARVPGRTASREAAIDFLEVGARRVRQDLADRPELRAAILNRIGRTFGSLGHGDRAEELIREALETRQIRLSPEHPDIAESLSDLAGVVRYTDSPAKAEALFLKAIEIRREKLGPSLELARSLLGLAKAVGDLGRTEEAKDLATEAWTMGSQKAGPTDIETLDFLVVYASALASSGELEEAEKLLREGLETTEGLDGPQRSFGAFFTHQLAVVLYQLGRPAEAEEFFRLAIGKFEVMFSPDSDLVASAVGNLGLAVRDQGRLEEAQELLLRALGLTRDLHGSQHPKVVSRLNNLASLGLRQGDPEGAEVLYLEALDTAQEVLPEGHRLWANLLAGAGYARVLQGRSNEAEQQLRRAVALALEARGEDHWVTSYYRLSLGHCLLKLGRIEEARPLIVQAREPIFAARPRGGGQRQRVLEVLIELHRSQGESLLVDRYQEELEQEIGPSVRGEHS